MPLLTGIFADILQEERERLAALSHEIRSSASLENPATPLSAPADWLFETLSGGFGIDGQLHVNEQTAMQLNTVRACVRAIAEDVGTVPLHLYRQSGSKVELADKRNEYWLLHRQPNPNMTACIFRECMTATALLWGNAYAEIVYNNAGKITALWPLHPAFVRLEMLPGPQRKIRYIASDPYGSPDRAILAEDVLHLKGMSLDGYVGLYTIRHHRVTIGLALALENFGLYYFMNGSRPGGVLEVLGSLTPEAQQRIRESWSHLMQGPRNANRVAILEQGMKFNPIAINNDNAQYVENRKLSDDAIARMFRVPPHVIGILEKATFSNIEHQSLDYVKSCLRPWFTRWEQELDTKLFPSDVNYRFEHDEDGLLRGDFATRMTGYATARQWGWLSVNDIRRHENMNPIGSEGDIYLTPLNMQDAADGGSPKPADKPTGPAPKEDPNAPPVETGAEPPQNSAEPDHTPQFRNALEPMFSDAVRRALHCDRNKQTQRYISQAFTPVLTAMAKLCGHQAAAEVTARAYADRLHLRLEEWDAKTAESIISDEFEMAWVSMTPANTYESNDANLQQ